MLTKVSDTRQGITLIEIEGKTLVSGLYWQVLTNPNAIMAEARAFARRERERTGEPMDVVSIRRAPDVIQAGFVVRGAGAQKGMYSLATAACDALGDSFVAAFDLGNGRFATIACQRGAIIPDSDGVRDAADARKVTQELWRALSGTLENGELKFYAPRSIVSDAEPVSLQELLTGLNRSHRLRQLSWFSPREIAVLSGCLAVALAGFWGISAYLAHRTELAAAAKAAEAAQRRRLLEESGMSASERALMHPWSMQPRTSIFAGLCTQAIWSLPLTLDGWALAEAQCSIQEIKAGYVRTTGRTVAGFRAKAAAWRPDLILLFAATGDSVDIRWRLPMQAGGDDPLVPFQTVSQALVSALQRQWVTVELAGKPSAIASTYTRPPELADLPPPAVEWKTGRWTVKPTGRTPSAFLKNLPDQGLRITQLSLSFENNGALVWSASGEIYGK